MQNEGASGGSGPTLTVGKLITFQLYWGLIQSGYQSIMSVLSSLTKASGAAQRVLTLIDSLPDIDPDAGMKVLYFLSVLYRTFFVIFSIIWYDFAFLWRSF